MSMSSHNGSYRSEYFLVQNEELLNTGVNDMQEHEDNRLQHIECVGGNLSSVNTRRLKMVFHMGAYVYSNHTRRSATML